MVSELLVWVFVGFPCGTALLVVLEGCNLGNMGNYSPLPMLSTNSLLIAQLC